MEVEEAKLSVLLVEMELTEAEQKKVEEVKRAIEQLESSDETRWAKSAHEYELVRFLRGHEHDTERALKMLKGTSKWRAERSIDELLLSYDSDGHEAATFFKEYFPSGAIGHLPDGGLVTFYRMAMVDFPELIKRYTVQELVKFNVWQLENAWRKYPRGNGILVIDLGVNDGQEKSPINSLWDIKPFLSALMQTVKAVSAEVDPNYPESFRKIFFVRPPSVFWASWKIAQYFVAERTRSKMNVLNGKKSLQELHNHVPKTILPTYLGGEQDTIPIPNGGSLKSSTSKK